MAGRVSIDGKVVRDPATRIISTQKVTVDGAEVSGERCCTVLNKFYRLRSEPCDYGYTIRSLV